MRAFLDWCLTHTAQKGNDFARLRAFYAWGVARRYPDFCYETLSILKSIKAPGTAKGHHVRFRHPTKGPFSPEELFAIRKAIQAEQGTDRDRAIVMIHLELGLNPYATIRITNADFKRYETMLHHDLSTRCSTHQKTNSPSRNEAQADQQQTGAVA